ncbi:MAG: transcription antitermination factor NusB [Firmicutes bacterium]|nr:transcription antitermination factor NusB [Bacillota bacterium]
MKTNRQTMAREAAFQILFSSKVGDEDVMASMYSFFQSGEAKGLQGIVEKKIRAWNENSKKIDNMISAHLHRGKLEDLPNVSLCALRLGICEMEYMKEVPPRVVIDEAVELVKKFGDAPSAGFVNGVMDAHYKQISTKGDKSEQNGEGTSGE